MDNLLTIIAIIGLCAAGFLAVCCFIYLLGYFFERGKLYAAKLFLKEIIADKDDGTIPAICKLEMLLQLSRMDAYEQYYKVFGGKKDGPICK